MAETNNEFNSSLFMEEVQLYECLYNKHCRDYKNKFIRLNCWKKIAEKFNIDAAEAEKKYKNIRTAYGRYLRKKKSIPSGSGRDVAPIPSEFANLDWLVTHINQRANTMMNISLFKEDSREENTGGLDIPNDRKFHDNVENEEDIDDSASVISDSTTTESGSMKGKSKRQEDADVAIATPST